MIEQELRCEQDLANVNGLDLRRCLITPIKEAYLLSNSEEVHLWTVLKENIEGEGYCIFYDDDEEMYGLGIKSIDGIYNIGYYGTFLQTIHSM
ncbi:hypothetical protein D3C87_2029700 [compost metagenome]